MKSGEAICGGFESKVGGVVRRGWSLYKKHGADVNKKEAGRGVVMRQGEGRNGR